MNKKPFKSGKKSQNNSSKAVVSTGSTLKTKPYFYKNDEHQKPQFSAVLFDNMQKKLNELVRSSANHTQNLQDHREEIAIHHSQTQIFSQLAQTFDTFTQSLRFLSILVVFALVVAFVAAYIVWNDVRNVPSSLSIIGREVRFSTGNTARNDELCDEMQYEAIKDTKAKSASLVQSIGALEIVSTEILILSDCVERQMATVFDAENANTPPQNPADTLNQNQQNVSELLTSVQVTISYR